MSDLETAIQLACCAQAGQVDKAKKPYILHPLRLMLRLETEEEQIAAVLHDVVEDSPTPLADLSERGFPNSGVTAIDALTLRNTESYEEFVDRLACNPLARSVKIQDLLDNLDANRLPELTESDENRMHKYRRALDRLRLSE